MSLAYLCDHVLSGLEQCGRPVDEQVAGRKVQVQERRILGVQIFHAFASVNQDSQPGLVVDVLALLLQVLVHRISVDQLHDNVEGLKGECIDLQCYTSYKFGRLLTLQSLTMP